MFSAQSSGEAQPVSAAPFNEVHLAPTARLTVLPSRATSRHLTATRTHPDAPRVLVLLASYNGQPWVEQQLCSVLAQEDVNIHVVVRDDCSTDGTLATLQNIADTDDRLSVSRSSQPSGSASQNFFSLITENSPVGFDFIAFADQDDTWWKDKLSRACAQLLKSGAAGYSSAVDAEWEDGKRRTIRQGIRPCRLDFLYEGGGQGCTFVLRADFYMRVRSFIAERKNLVGRIVFHDWTIYALARCWGLDWTFDPQPTMVYRQHENNSIGARSSLAGVLKRLSLIRSGWYKGQLESIASLCLAAAPDHPMIGRWARYLKERRSASRRIRVAAFSLVNGRRSFPQRVILAISALTGWI